MNPTSHTLTIWLEKTAEMATMKQSLGQNGEFCRK